MPPRIPDPTTRQIRPLEPIAPDPLSRPPDPPPTLDQPVPPPAAPGEAPLSGAARVFVRRFEFLGNTAFSDDELRRHVTAPFEGRWISAEELQEIRRRLTLLYVDRGYVSSGAVIPDQRVQDGIIRLQIVEGRLVGIDVTGTKALRSAYVRDRLALGTDPPLNVNSLHQRLLLLQQDPMIRRIQAELGPGANPGESALNVRVEEAPAFQVGIGFANDRSPSIGSNRALVFATHRSFTGNGDPLAVRYGFTRGLDDAGLDYAFPITASNTLVGLRIERSTSTVIEAPFDVLDIGSRTRTAVVYLNTPVRRSVDESLNVGVGLERKKSYTSLLGEPFSFSPGVREGRSTVTVLRVLQDWLRRSADQVIAVRSTFGFGLDAYGATINSDAPDGRFVTWLGQFQWARRLGTGDSQLLFRTDVQRSRDPLLPLEKFAVGGMATVRGYRENQLVRDNGLVMSLELRVPFARLAIPNLSSDDEGTLQLAPFVDYGHSSNTDSPSPPPRSIGSVGLGLRWLAARSFFAEIYYGHQLRRIDIPGNDLQDRGVHFRLSVQTD